MKSSDKTLFDRGASRDIAERKQKEEAVRESESELHNILNFENNNIISITRFGYLFKGMEVINGPSYRFSYS